MSDEVTVGVLSLHNSKETKAICNAVAALGHDPEWLRPENVTVTTGDGSPRLDPAVDVLVNRLLVPKEDDPLEVVGLLRTLERVVDGPTLNPAAAVVGATHKFAAMVALDEAGLPVPSSAMAIGSHRLESLTPFGPAGDADPSALSDRIFKRPVGTHGDQTVRLEPGERAPQFLSEGQGVVQEMVTPPDGDHEDVRVYVVGDEPVAAMRRHAAEGDWRTNVARGGRVRDAAGTLPDEVLEMAVEAADVLDLDVAGVDVIEGVDGWYLLEVNVTAGFKGLYEATGYSPAPAIAALAIERAGGDVDRDEVADLALELDDAVPPCRPPLQRRPSSDDAVVGYTEEVVLAGQSGSVVTTAKSDTGATRTSVDLELAGRIGAGPIQDTASVKGDVGTSRPLVPVAVRIGDYTHRVVANVRDRSNLNHDVLLGRDILENYAVKVDRREGDGATTAGDERAALSFEARDEE
jgi:RimK family alpha-L-glutamate ligase